MMLAKLLSILEFPLKVIALLSSGLFTGAAFYLTAVEHPARIGAWFALQEFKPSYKRAAPLQASLAVICFLSSGTAWRLTNRWESLAGGALVGAVVPFTIIFIMPANRLLLDAASGRAVWTSPALHLGNNRANHTHEFCSSGEAI